MNDTKIKNIIKLLKKDDPELAYFCGVLLGDGSLSLKECENNKFTRLQISFNSIDDLDYLHFVKMLIEKLFGVSPIIKFRKNENTADIHIFRKNIICFLVYDLEMKTSPKWNRVEIPKIFMNKPYDLEVLRGYFDTDGCLVTTKNNGTIYPRLEMKISPSPMQFQFVEILKKYDFNFGVYNIGKGKVRIQINGKNQLKKWNELIGFNNVKHSRKLKRFI